MSVLLQSQKFQTPKQSYSLPQAGAGKVLVSNYSFSSAADASTAQNITVFSSLSPYQTINVLRFELALKLLSSTSAFKQIGIAQLSIFGAVTDLPIPYPAGMSPTVLSPVLTATGDPSQTFIRMSLGDGIAVQPNTSLTATIQLYSATALLITDQITGTLKMFWSL